MLHKFKRALLDNSRVHNGRVALQRSMKGTPYLDPNMEFRYGVWGGISSIHCEDGRQLGENNTEPYGLKEAIDTEYRPCKFDDSRNGGVMNMSALHAMMTLWDDALDISRVLQRAFEQKYQADEAGAPATVVELYLLAKIATCLPAWLVRRRGSQWSDGRLDNRIAAQFQLISGVFMIGRHMQEIGEAGLQADLRMSALELFNYADEHGIFISPDGQVCGGSRKKIIEFLELLLSRSDQRGWNSNCDAWFKTLFGNNGEHLSSYQDYADTAIRMELELLSIKQSYFADMLVLTEQACAADASQAELLKRCWLGNLSSCESVTEMHVIARQRNRVVTLFLNRLCKHDTVSMAQTVTPVEYENINTLARRYEEALLETKKIGSIRQSHLHSLLGVEHAPALLRNAIFDRLGVSNRKLIESSFETAIRLSQ